MQKFVCYYTVLICLSIIDSTTNDVMQRLDVTTKFLPVETSLH